MVARGANIPEELPMSSTWISRPAVLWVLYEAPDVPARLLSTLLVMAVYAGNDGKGTYPSAATVAQLTRKSDRQAERDLHELEKRKLLRRGNQRLVAHIRSDRRPVVYDLPMPSRGDTHDTSSRGDIYDAPHANGVTPMTSRGDIQGPDGVSPMSDEEALKRAGRGERGAVGATPPLASDEEPVPLADLLAQVRSTAAVAQQAQRQGRPIIGNSAFYERQFIILDEVGADGKHQGICCGTAADMGEMAAILESLDALDAELQHIGLQSGHHGDHGDDPARYTDDEGPEG